MKWICFHFFPEWLYLFSFLSDSDKLPQTTCSSAQDFSPTFVVTPTHTHTYDMREKSSINLVNFLPANDSREEELPF